MTRYDKTHYLSRQNRLKYLLYIQFIEAGFECGGFNSYQTHALWQTFRLMWQVLSRQPADFVVPVVSVFSGCHEVEIGNRIWWQSYILSRQNLYWRDSRDKSISIWGLMLHCRDICCIFCRVRHVKVWKTWLGPAKRGWSIFVKAVGSQRSKVFKSPCTVLN